MLDPAKRRQRGLAVYKEMGWGENEAIREVDEDLWQLTTDFLFGEIWARPGLSLRERELITLTILMSCMTDGMITHMRRAHHLGITFEEMKELVLHATYYLGTPSGMWAMRKLKAVQAEHEKEQKKKAKGKDAAKSTVKTAAKPGAQAKTQAKTQAKMKAKAEAPPKPNDKPRVRAKSSSKSQ